MYPAGNEGVGGERGGGGLRVAVERMEGWETLAALLGMWRGGFNWVSLGFG